MSQALRRFVHLAARSALSFAFLLTILIASANARADLFSTYSPAGTFTLPAAGQPFDVLPGGRTIALSGASVYVETASGSHVFSLAGALPSADIPSFGAAFLRVSPDGTRIAVGNNGGASFSNYQVGVFTVSTLGGTWFTANHFDGEWIDNRYVALTAGDFTNPSTVSALDTQSPTPSAPSNVTIVNNIGGASGGIAFDSAGNLYTANGFVSGGPSTTGSIYAITSASWHAALSGGSPVNFETQGKPIVDLLSGSPLGFDGEGNLLVGGSDGFGSPPDANYFALVKASAVAAALAGGGLINVNDASRVRKLDPDPAASSSYLVGAIVVRGEVLAVPSGSTTAYVYRGTPAPVPALPVWGTGLLAIALVVASRRRVLQST